MVEGWRERKKAELREEIYEEALRLFRTQGYQKTTVDQITEAVGVAKGTFFNHFPQKANLLAAWYRRMTLDSLAEAEATPRPGCREAVTRLFRCLAVRATEDGDLMVSRVLEKSPALASEEEALDRQLTDFLRERFELGMASGEIPPVPDAPFLAAFVLSLLTGTARRWVTEARAFSLVEELDAQLTFLFDLMAADSESSI